MSSQVFDHKTLRMELNTLLNYLPDGLKLKNPLYLYYKKSSRNITWMTSMPFVFNENTQKNGVAFIDLLKYLRALVVLENVKVVLYYDVNISEILNLKNDLIIKINSSKLRNQF